VTDESDLGTARDEPSLDDFEAAEEDEPEAGARGAVHRILRLLGVLLVIVALLVYFATVPLHYVFSSVPFHWRPSGGGTRTIPLAPEHRSPKLPA